VIALLRPSAIEPSLGLPSIVGSLRDGVSLPDTDCEGLSDAGESDKCSSPSDLNDGNADGHGDGWTNVEEYINSLVE
jgi:hypothetical protein